MSAEAKNELIEKTLMDMVTMHLVLGKIDSSTDDRVRLGRSRGVLHRCAHPNGCFHHDDRADEARGGGQLQHPGVLGRGEHQRGDHHRPEGSPSVANRDKIRELYQALYAQNVLKYAYEIDAKLAEGSSAAGTASNVDALGDLVAEGLAFWRILKPFITTQADEDSLDDIFSLDNVPSSDAPTVQGARHWNYCRAKKVVDAHGDAFRWNRQRGGHVRPRHHQRGHVRCHDSHRGRVR